jgi:hypothetical protein
LAEDPPLWRILSPRIAEAHPPHNRKEVAGGGASKVHPDPEG